MFKKEKCLDYALYEYKQQGKHVRYFCFLHAKMALTYAETNALEMCIVRLPDKLKHTIKCNYKE